MEGGVVWRCWGQALLYSLKGEEIDGTLRISIARADRRCGRCPAAEPTASQRYPLPRYDQTSLGMHSVLFYDVSLKMK